MRMVSCTLARLTLLAALTLSPAAPALAQDAPSASETALAREQHNEGMAHARAGRWPAAYGAFARAYALVRRPLVLLNLAGAEEQTGRLVESAEHYRQFLREVTSGREAQQRPVAEQGLSRVEPRIPRARFILEGTRPADTYALDDKPLAPAVMGSPLPLDPGTHTLVVRHAEGELGRITFVLAEGEAQDVRLTVTRPAAPVAERTPLHGTYRGYDIITMPPPSSGGIALLQMFAMLEPHDVGALGAQSAAKYHLFTEVMRRAFRDRAEYLGDPDFVKVPVAELLDRTYLKKRMADFSPTRATPSEKIEPGLGTVKLTSLPPGSPGLSLSHHSTLNAQLARLAPESTETTHFSIVDAAGNAVANTSTLNGGYGSGVTIPGTGILMNNEMDDFTAKVGVKNMYGLLQGPANAIVPGKRPLSSMTPTIVLKDKKLFFVTGSPGGPTIINTVLQIVSNVIDFGMSVTQAVESPRIHHQWMPDSLSYERNGLSTDTANILKSLGHSFKERASYEGAYQGDGETIMVDPQTNLRLGASDLRRGDSKAVGY